MGRDNFWIAPTQAAVLGSDLINMKTVLPFGSKGVANEVAVIVKHGDGGAIFAFHHGAAGDDATLFSNRLQLAPSLPVVFTDGLPNGIESRVHDESLFSFWIGNSE